MTISRYGDGKERKMRKWMLVKGTLGRDGQVDGMVATEDTLFGAFEEAKAAFDAASLGTADYGKLDKRGTYKELWEVVDGEYGIEYVGDLIDYEEKQV